MRVGFVGLWWPPAHGGAEQYLHRLATALAARRIPVRALIASARPDHAVPAPAELPVQWVGALKEGSTSASVPRRFALGSTYALWRSAALDWMKAEQLTHVIVNQSAATILEELVTHLPRETRPRVGYVLHDYTPPGLMAALVRGYWATPSWSEVLKRVLEDERTGVTAHFQGDDGITRLPLDFLIANTDIHRQLADPMGRLPAITLHPRVPDFLASCAADALAPRVTVSMLNPQGTKGAALMASLIESAPKDWTFRVLQGGWGNAFSTFSSLIPAALHLPDRVHLCERVDDIARFFQATEVFICPSVYEGYGMAPVEALYSGTLTVVADYYARAEATAEGTPVVPLFAHAGDWIRAIEEALDARGTWRERAARRKAELIARQERELDELISFLGNL